MQTPVERALVLWLQENSRCYLETEPLTFTTLDGVFDLKDLAAQIIAAWERTSIT